MSQQFEDFKIDDNPTNRAPQPSEGTDADVRPDSQNTPFPKNMPPLPPDPYAPKPTREIVDEEVVVETVYEEVIVTTDCTDQTAAPHPEQPDAADRQTRPEQPQAAAAPLSEELAARLSMLDEAVAALSAKFDERLCNDERKDALFNKMYDELAAYKNDIYAKLLKPMVLATITLLDDVNRMVERDIEGRDLAEIDTERLVRFVRGVPGDLEEILLTNGVEIYSDTDSELFNPRTQRALKQIATDDPALDNHIAARIRNGYRWNGVQLRPEMVHIYKLKK